MILNHTGFRLFNHQKEKKKTNPEAPGGCICCDGVYESSEGFPILCFCDISDLYWIERLGFAFFFIVFDLCCI